MANANFKSAVKFSGLSTYPNTLSETQPGALQIASEVVIDQPGVITPRRGQRPYAVYNINLLTSNEATGGDTLASLDGFFAGQLATYNTPGSDAILALIGPYPSTAWQGQYSVRVIFTDSTPTAGACLLVTVPTAGTYTFSTYASLVGSSSGVNVALEVLDSSSTVLLSSLTPIVGSAGYSRFSGTFTTSGPLDLQIGVSLDVGHDNELFIDGLQLEAGSIASVWAPPQNLVCTRLFQVRDNMYGFFTADGLPSSPGSFIRIVNTVAGDAEPTAASAAFSVTPNYFLPPPANAVHSYQANGNTFFTTNDGIMKLLADLTGADSGTLVPAGMPLGLDIQGTLSTPPGGSRGWLQGGYATAYRVLWGNTDPQNNLTLGAPSPAITVANPMLTNQGQLQLGFPVSDATFPYPASLLFVQLPWTASITAGYDVDVVQGGTMVTGRMFTISGQSIAQIDFHDTAQYFGPVGTPVSVVILASATAFSAGPPATLTFATGVVQTGGSGWAGNTTIYQPVDPANPASTAGTTASSSVLTTPSATTLTVTTGSAFTTGNVGVLSACTVIHEQLDYLYVQPAGGTIILPMIGDQVQIPGVTGLLTVTNVQPLGGVGSPDYAVTFDQFPTGALLTGLGLFDIFRPSDVTLTFVVPPEAYLYTPESTGQATVAFYQIYRSSTQSQIVDGVITQPTDDMRLAYQGTITGANPGPGTPSILTVVDIAPDATLGTTIYTSPAEGGILTSRYQPPVASDMAAYQGSALYANCWTPARYSTQLLGVSATPNAGSNLQPGDKVTVNGFDFTAVYPGPSTPGDFTFTISTGSGSVTTDINTTVVNLSRAINDAYVQVLNPGAVGETVILLSTAQPTDQGGTFFIQAMRGLGSFTFTFTANSGVAHASPFQQLPPGPVLPQQLQNALFFSPPDLPEAVPVTNSINVGQPNYPIQRVLPLPGSAIIFKDYEGFYQLSGATTDQFSVQQENTSIQLQANESAVVLQSTIIAYTNQGVVSLSPSGIQILSLAINDTLRALTELPAFASTSFGVAHEAERRYMLYSPSVDGDTLPTQAFTYHMLTGAWTQWTTPRVCGLANVADQLLYTGGYQASPVYDQPVIYGEAAQAGAGSPLNYGDELVSGTYTVIDTTHGTFTGFLAGQAASIAATFQIGSSIATLSGGVIADVAFPASITLSDASTLLLTFTTPVDLASGPATLVQATVSVWAPIPIFGDDPGTVKQFQEFVINYNTTTSLFMDCVTATDFNEDSTVLPLTLFGQAALPAGGWGIGGWGMTPWGGQTPALSARVQSARQLVPRGAARGHNFFPTVTARCALSSFGAQGITLAWTHMETLRTK